MHAGVLVGVLPPPSIGLHRRSLVWQVKDIQARKKREEEEVDTREGVRMLGVTEFNKHQTQVLEWKW